LSEKAFDEIVLKYNGPVPVVPSGPHDPSELDDTNASVLSGKEFAKDAILVCETHRAGVKERKELVCDEVDGLDLRESPNEFR
jgi:hypothetical protein